MFPNQKVIKFIMTIFTEKLIRKTAFNKLNLDVTFGQNIAQTTHQNKFDEKSHVT